jgi:hypothetical protein
MKGFEGFPVLGEEKNQRRNWKKEKKIYFKKGRIF